MDEIAKFLKEIEQYQPAPQSDWGTPLMGGIMEDFNNREAFIENYGFSFPSRSALETIVRFIDGEQVLEIFSGLALWSKLLELNGVDVMATDANADADGTIHTTYKFGGKQTFVPVQKLEAMEAVLDIPRPVLLMSWPPYADESARRAIKRFKGHKIIYIGEGSGGCCADDGFFDILHKRYELVGHADIPTYCSIHDDVELWQRKKK